MRPRPAIVKRVNHNILRFYFRSDARCRELWPFPNDSLFLRQSYQGYVVVQRMTRARPARDGSVSDLADEDRGHGRGLVGELARERQVPPLEGVVGLLHEAAGGVVLGAAVGVERGVIDALEVA